MSDDPLNMIDVLREADLRAQAQRKAANAFIGGYALRALLSGVDPKALAEKLGFKDRDAVIPEGMEQLFDHVQAVHGPWAIPEGVTPPRSAHDQMQEFLHKAVDDLIRSMKE